MDWLVHAAVRAVGGRAAPIPWVMFVVTAVLTASARSSRRAVAIVAPIALGFAVQYGINPVLMGLMVINGATAGGFSPISVFGSIVNGVVERNDLAENATLLFVSARSSSTSLLSVVVFFLFGGRELLGHAPRRATDDDERAPGASSARPGARAGRQRPPIAGGAVDDRAGEVPELDRDKILTLIGIVALIVVALAFDVDVGFVALHDRRRAVADHRRRRPRARSRRSRGRPCC